MEEQLTAPQLKQLVVAQLGTLFEEQNKPLGETSHLVQLCWRWLPCKGGNFEDRLEGFRCHAIQASLHASGA